MDRVYNFSAGPSMMPLEVLEEAQRDMLNYPGAGCSVMEMSHRTPAFESILNQAQENLRKLMNIPDDYAVLFMQGGATMQFSMVACNLANEGDITNYAITGNFAKKAMEEAIRRTEAIAITSSKDANFTYIPEITDDMITPGAKYLHITGNNTIFGTRYTKTPNHAGTRLVADWSSAILGQDIPVADYDLIYAGAQKNMGPSGMAIVILKKEIIGEIDDQKVPVMLRYKPAFDNNSMYNTPPTFSIYMAGLMFKWAIKMGGVKELEKINTMKANMLYDYIDNSKMFTNPVNPKDRSIMNVTFTLPSEDDTKALLEMAKKRGIINIKGHRLVGGLRASIYNGMPIEGVKKLIELMDDFENGKRD